jgi:hypothetical protein
MRCVVREPGDKTKVESADVNNGLNVLIKIPVLGSAAGELGSLVTITAVKGMPDGVFFKQKVAGLTCSTGGGCRDGTMYFCLSKCGCPALWQDLFKTYIIPVIAEAANHHKHKVCQLFLLLLMGFCNYDKI